MKFEMVENVKENFTVGNFRVDDFHWFQLGVEKTRFDFQQCRNFIFSMGSFFYDPLGSWGEIKAIKYANSKFVVWIWIKIYEWK
jgi:hypothetical protein